ncbi:MAG: M42 family peptidase [Lentisphaerae bacterium]|jgi:putative aminopeptidase FrvX|nr:M42 family peptidase [Lentisphaerota bacterium]MBT4822768.1 M42 family peptidase [Lentisphaerota bacterium]MBT5606754.1 M42 family peptidase [Lentisphaerota bacterium]MBT7061550.1 M42 family peptidase [Lentisphaerota bacterium]MBT7843899.1 M42 family peptidase [Lentisphaerota bacterium]
MREHLVELLEKLLITHSPGGQEEEIDSIIREALPPGIGELVQDPHGNLYVHIPGQQSGPLSVVAAHKDELSVVVRKIDPDGKMWIEPVGGMLPGKFGEGPFDLITRTGVIEGVLCMGSTHSSSLSGRVHQIKTGAISWDIVYLDCKLTGDELRDQGVLVGDRAVVGRRRKPPLFLPNDHVAGHALDDKAAVAVLLLLARELLQTPPIHDLCLAFTAAEEGGVSGGAYLSRQLNPHDLIAVEVAPIAEEYPITMSSAPVLLFKDAIYHYSTPLTHELLDAGQRVGLSCQTAVVRSFGSDASISTKAGLVGRAACLCFPTENTHGYEITMLPALENCVRLLASHLTSSNNN